MVFVDCLVHLFVIFNAFLEIGSSLIGVDSQVVGTCRLDVPNVGQDEVLIVTFAFDKHDLNTLGLYQLTNPLAAILGAVCGIEDTDDATATEPTEHVVDGCLGGRPTLLLTIFILRVEEVGRRVSSVFATVIADIESLCLDGEPAKISLSWQSYGGGTHIRRAIGLVRESEKKGGTGHPKNEIRACGKADEEKEIKLREEENLV